MKIAIVGSGFTGLTAAYYLAENPQNRITVFEKENILGGLAYGIKFGKVYLDGFYRHIFVSDQEFLNLSKEIGYENKLQWLKSSTTLFSHAKMYPFTTPKDLLSFPHLNLLDKLRFGLTTLYLQKRKNWQGFEKITAKTWLEKYVGKHAFRAVWKPLLKGKFGEYWSQINMAWFWSRVYTRRGGQGKSDNSLSETLIYPRGGFQGFIETMAKKTKRANFLTNCEVTCVSKQKSKFLVSWRNLKTRKQENQLFDKVILTLANPLVNKVVPSLPKETRNRLAKIEYLGCISLVFISPQNLSSYYWTNITEKDFPFLAFIQHTNLVSKKDYQGYHVYYLGKYLKTNDALYRKSVSELLQEFTPFLKIINPEFNLKKIKKAWLSKAPYAQHLVTPNYSSLIPDYELPFKNLYLANFSQIYPYDRGVNYAIREGKKIAKLIDKGDN